MKSSDEPVDAIIYGKDLKSEGENDLSEERFDKIRYYLRHQLYPQGADRSEKSRLRSAATHYKLVGGQDGGPEKLFLKDKEVISDPSAQYEIAKQIHLQAHGGINKTTAIIATKYHWIRIKETVSHVIKNCPECKDVNKPPILRSENRPGRSKTIDEAPPNLPQAQPPQPDVQSLPQESQTLTANHLSDHDFASIQQPMDLSDEHNHLVNDHNTHLDPYDEMAIDPQIMEQIQAQLAEAYDPSDHAYVSTGLPPFADTSHLQPHHDPHDFNRQTSDHHFIPDPNRQTSDHHFIPDPNRQMMPHENHQLMTHDHIMDDGGAGTGLNNMQPMQYVLNMDDPQNQPQYKLEQ